MIGSCPCCGGTLRPLYCIDRFTPPLDIFSCRECSFQLQGTAHSDPNQFYQEEYYTGGADYSYRDERERKRFDDFVHRARLRRIGRFVRPPADFLDVGCAFGSLVRAAGEAGYRARGLDVSSYAASEARKAGLDVTEGDLTSGEIGPASVDVLTMIEVLEHLAQPEATFAALSEIVRPGGLVVIQTANFLGWQARLAGSSYHYYLPGHLHYYSTRTVRAFLNRHGFSRVQVFRPVDFGLLPKLKKSRGDFVRPLHYLRWGRIAWYHLLGRIAWGDFALTSSMTVYALRDSD